MFNSINNLNEVVRHHYRNLALTWKLRKFNASEQLIIVHNFLTYINVQTSAITNVESEYKEDLALLRKTYKDDNFVLTIANKVIYDLALVNDEDENFDNFCYTTGALYQYVQYLVKTTTFRHSTFNELMRTLTRVMMLYMNCLEESIDSINN